MFNFILIIFAIGTILQVMFLKHLYNDCVKELPSKSIFCHLIEKFLE